MLDILLKKKNILIFFKRLYLYVAAEKYNLTIISFDNDFDRTERGRKIPEEIQ